MRVSLYAARQKPPWMRITTGCGPEPFGTYNSPNCNDSAPYASRSGDEIFAALPSELREFIDHLPFPQCLHTELHACTLMQSFLHRLKEQPISVSLYRLRQRQCIFHQGTMP